MAILCTDIETLVQAYLDGELDNREFDEFETHTAECGACKGRVQRELEFRTMLQRKLAAPDAPPDLSQRLLAALDEVDSDELGARRRDRSRFSWVLPGIATFAAAAALLLFLRANTTTSTYSGSGATAARLGVSRDAVEAHLRRQPIEVQGASAVSPWIKRHFEPTVEPPRFSTTDISLRGARLGHLRGRDAAQLFYEVERNRQRHDVQVHILDGANLDLGNAKRRRIGSRDLWVDDALGYSIITYRDASDGMAYVFTSDMKSDELLDLVVGSDLLLKVSERRSRR